MTALALQAPVAYDVTTSRAACAEANVLADCIVEVRKEMRSAYGITQNRRDRERRLIEALQSVERGDAQAIATATAAANFAQEFLRILPESVESPEIDLSVDGRVVCEWITAPRNRLVVSFSQTGDLNFASLHPAGEVKGREHFAGFIPDTIALALSRVLG